MKNDIVSILLVALASVILIGTLSVFQSYRCQLVCNKVAVSGGSVSCSLSEMKVVASRETVTKDVKRAEIRVSRVGFSRGDNLELVTGLNEYSEIYSFPRDSQEAVRLQNQINQFVTSNEVSLTWVKEQPRVFGLPIFPAQIFPLALFLLFLGWDILKTLINKDSVH